MALKLWKEKISFTISMKEFHHAFPFFLLGFSGWIASKIDIYIVDFYLPKARLSEYQLLITAFLMLQALSAYITLPFTKHIYRLADSIVKKIQKKLYWIAIPLVSVGSLIIWIVMEQFVQLNLNYNYYIVGGLIALPSFFYELNVMQLLKNHKEKKVILINCIGFIINFIFILTLIKEYQIFGVLLSVCITKWLVLIIYKLESKKIKSIRLF
ncbi:hypothetical protein [Aquimarina sp. 2201CG14-23]|uniref:hypothetical protein n=1 Tax=Aquimarina mycalae TaxID=3040073 RepID=UPI00247824E7|nr:hypothetical protein [Aquimarina sp. 2201CG14-23]MDH7448046.1 hypothetical protein [Aquimarina sp. 2201CG14-23]